MNSTFGANKRWTSEVKAQYISTKGNNRPSGGQEMAISILLFC